MNTQYYCKNKERRDLLLLQATLNGIDFLEVLDEPGLGIDERQTILVIHLINSPATPLDIKKENILIEGGSRVKNIKALWAFPASKFSSLPADAGVEPNNLVSDNAREIILAQAEPDRVLVVRTNSQGDFSIYTLKLVKEPDNPVPPVNYDPILSGIEFSFKVKCPSEFDCKNEKICPPQAYPEPGINYLAKDYAGFRRLMLDRLSLLMPAWKERNPADLQVALVELLAYVGDRLSYYQDAVATEAYLGTARQRISVRRHARLVDYFMHDGCNARAWIALEIEPGGAADGEKLPQGTPFLTTCANEKITVAPPDLEKILNKDKPEVFETMFEITLHSSRNTIRFYTWSDRECCLPAGATRATLYDAPSLNLAEGDFLLFEEVINPGTGKTEDSDLSHRHVVRLSQVEAMTDPLDGTDILNIYWRPEDALPFPFCISTILEKGGGSLTVEDVSIARGNIVLADHGLSRTGDFTTGQTMNINREPLRLPQGPVTGTEGFEPVNTAAAAMKRELHNCLPVVWLIEEPTGVNIKWEARRDLLASGEFAAEFVVETESDGTAYLRFGDNIMGEEPGAGREFKLFYRIGNGTQGNVGAETISHAVWNVNGITRVRNPLSAVGGVAMESIEEVRQFAPQAFRTQERAVTEQDYADMAMRFPGIQKAVARFRWTGSWTTVFLAVDRLRGEGESGASAEGDALFKKDLYAHMEKYRMAGFDLELQDPVYVPLDIALSVCVKPGYFKSDVQGALLNVFSNYLWGPGERGFFHPDNFTFAQPVYLGRIYETAMKVAGVAFVEVTRFQRWGKAPNNEISLGFLKTGAVEIVRLDNDPNFPENGKIEFEMKGGI